MIDLSGDLVEQSFEQRRRVLFVTSFHPGGMGLIGAGEAISAETVRRLRNDVQQLDVLCVAPGYQRKNVEIMDFCDSYTQVAVNRWATLHALIGHFLSGAWIAPWFFTRVFPEAVSELRRLILEKKPTEVWIDFPSSLGFSGHIDGLPIHYFVHDIVSQKTSRSLLKRLFSSSVKRIESSLFRRVSHAYVLSNKDRDLLQELGFTGEISVWPAQALNVGKVDNGRPIVDVVAEFGEGPNMVFFGNMGRPENGQSIAHFALFRLWRVRRAFPSATLWVIGLAPGLGLRMLGRIVPGLKVTGAVDDPTLAFRAAALCIAPLLFGAGVKIKVLQMLDAGATVIASPVGAEGIDPTSKLIVVENSQMVVRIIEFLRRPMLNIGS